MNICNMNNQSRLYSGDYRVHYRTHPAMQNFAPLRSRVKYTKAESSILRFSHKFESTAETFFAFCIPWSCDDNARFLKRLIERFPQSAPLGSNASRTAGTPGPSSSSSGDSSGNSPSPDAGAPAQRHQTMGTDAASLAAAAATDSQCTSGIYFHCQTLAHTLQNRPINILTITDSHGLHDTLDEPLLPGTSFLAATLSDYPFP